MICLFMYGLMHKKCINYCYGSFKLELKQLNAGSGDKNRTYLFIFLFFSVWSLKQVLI